MIWRVFGAAALVLLVCDAPMETQGASPPALTITRITRDGVRSASVTDAVLRDLRGVVIQRGVRTGETLPDDVRVDVPPPDVLTITAPNGMSTATLNGGCSAFFHFTGAIESVTVTRGKATFDDPANFFRVSGPNGIDTSANEK